MSVQKIIQESLNKNPLGVKEALEEALQDRVRTAIEEKYEDMMEANDLDEEMDEAVKPVTKDAVLKIMVKNGNNPIAAKKKLEKEFDVAVKSYPDATASKIANYVMMGESFDLSDLTLEELEDFMMSEDFDQLDELDKKTLGSYVKKAKKSKAYHDREADAAHHDDRMSDSSDHQARSIGRQTGIDRAKARLKK